MVHKKYQTGYALIAVIMVIALITFLIASVINKVILFQRQSMTQVRYQQATWNAFSGIHIALGQIMHGHEKEDINKKEQGKKRSNLIVSHILKYLNYWQKFSFEGDTDENDCYVYIACEQGKLNINSLYNFEKHTYIKTTTVDGKEIAELIKKTFQQSALLFKYIDGLKIKNVDELSQIIPQKKGLQIFPDPHRPGISIYDLFTGETLGTKIQPFLLSSSLMKILLLNQSEKKSSDFIEQLLKQLKSKEQILNWEILWDSLLATFLNKKYTDVIPSIRALYAKDIEQPIFSVVSYGKCGSVVVKIYAILHSPSVERLEYCIKKLYWI